MDLTKKNFFLSVSGILLFCIASLLYALFQGVKPEQFQISFLDVGQGDAIFIQTVEGVQVLIDGGPKSAVITKLREVMPASDTSINMIVITNPDADHIGGFQQVLDEYTVESVLVAGTRSTTETYTQLMKKIKEKKIKQIAAYKNMNIVLGEESALSVLFPDQVVRSWDRNDGSIVMKLTHRETSVMLMGDASSETERLILSTSSPQTLVSQILKVGHHGSNTSTSEEWLDAVMPEIAIISAGEQNRYGHPHQEVVDRLNDRDIQIKETSTDGTITYVSDGTQWIQKK